MPGLGEGKASTHTPVRLQLSGPKSSPVTAPDRSVVTGDRQKDCPCHALTFKQILRAALPSGQLMGLVWPASCSVLSACLPSSRRARNQLQQRRARLLLTSPPRRKRDSCLATPAQELGIDPAGLAVLENHRSVSTRDGVNDFAPFEALATGGGHSTQVRHRSPAGPAPPSHPSPIPLTSPALRSSIRGAVWSFAMSAAWCVRHTISQDPSRGWTNAPELIQPRHITTLQPVPKPSWRFPHARRLFQRLRQEGMRSLAPASPLASAQPRSHPAPTGAQQQVLASGGEPAASLTYLGACSANASQTCSPACGFPAAPRSCSAPKPAAAALHCCLSSSSGGAPRSHCKPPLGRIGWPSASARLCHSSPPRRRGGPHRGVCCLTAGKPVHRRQPSGLTEQRGRFHGRISLAGLAPARQQPPSSLALRSLLAWEQVRLQGQLSAGLAAVTAGLGLREAAPVPPGATPPASARAPATGLRPWLSC